MARCEMKFVILQKSQPNIQFLIKNKTIFQSHQRYQKQKPLSHVDEIECRVESCIEEIRETKTKNQQVGLVSHPPVFYKKITWNLIMV